MGQLNGQTMPFLDRLRDRMLGQIPLTLVLSLRSMCLRAVFLQFYRIMLLGLIQMLLMSKVWRVGLVFIKEINFQYLVSWFLFLSSGEERDIFYMADSCSFVKSSSRESFPSLQLQRQSSLMEESLSNLLGLIQFLFNFITTREGFCSSRILICCMQVSPKQKPFKFKLWSESYSFCSLFLLKNALMKVYQFLQLNSISRLQHFYLNSSYRMEAYFLGRPSLFRIISLCGLVFNLELANLELVLGLEMLLQMSPMESVLYADSCLMVLRRLLIFSSCLLNMAPFKLENIIKDGQITTIQDMHINHGYLQGRIYYLDWFYAPSYSNYN